jgi:glycosyltransferase involved in cell wall biosynthesis
VPEVTDIALDARLTRQMSVGMKAYASELAARLPRVAPDLRFAALSRGENFSADEQFGMPLALRRMRPRLTHFLSVYAPVLAPAPFIITIHDLIHLRYPEFFKKKVGWYYQTIVRAVCARAARVITDDERTLEDLERFLGVPREKVRVIPLGCDDAYLREIEPLRTARPFFLYAGNHRQHKDLPTLLAAWAALPADASVDLYLTGEDDLLPEQRVTREHGTVKFLGEVATEQLARLYRTCVALAHPALCEGFGLPMLEAGAAGARVLACEDAVPTVLRLYVDCFAARDAAGLRALMERALAEGREPGSSRTTLREAARALTWDRCAAATAEAYRDVLEEYTP